jgi:arylsulfatase A-like enzyme
MAAESFPQHDRDITSWNLITAQADDAIAYMKRINALAPEQPFLLYYVPGATHSPHHATPEWIKKISDMHLFDKGWDALRDQIFANQKKLGVIPQDAKLTPWPHDLLKHWDELMPDEEKMFIRQADVYAAYLADDDYEIGRVIQAVVGMGKLDNTLIFYISGDNGSSAEGTLIGTPNEVASFNGVDVRSPFSSNISTTSGARTRPTPIWPCPGPGHSIRHTPGPSRSPRTSAAPNKAWQSPGRR